MKLSYFWIILIIALIKPSLLSQTIISNGTSKYISELEVALFPVNNKIEIRKSYYDCIQEKDSLILYIRVNQPNADSVIIILKNILFTRDTSLLPKVKELFSKHILYFRQEWESAFRQKPKCSSFEEQLKILDAFERTIYGLEHFKELSDPDKLYSRIIEYNAAVTKIRYKLYLTFYFSNSDVRDIMDINTYNLLNGMDSQDWVKEGEKANYMSNVYIKRISNEYNAFISSFINWNFYSPYLQIIRPKLTNLYNNFKILTPTSSLDYRVLYYLFNGTLNEEDYNTQTKK